MVTPTTRDDLRSRVVAFHSRRPDATFGEAIELIDALDAEQARAGAETQHLRDELRSHRVAVGAILNIPAVAARRRPDEMVAETVGQLAAELGRRPA